MVGCEAMVDEQRDARERRRRNAALALVLLGLVVLFYLTTLLRVHP
jgi:hypothetical protein